jgi:gluconolactonase
MAILNLLRRLKKRAKALFPKAPLEPRTKEFAGIFPSPLSLNRLATGFRFVEGPIWIAEEQSLLFSDIPGDTIYRLDREGNVSVFKKPSGLSNGLTRDRHGRLIACEHGNRRVTRTDRDGSTRVLAEMFEGKRLNSPNDVVVKSDGAVYFTDPPYGIKAFQQEQPFQGVYRISPSGHQITLLATDFERPNGLAFSFDQKRLFVTDSSMRSHIRVFDVRGDGSLGNGNVFAVLQSSERGAPDGMKVDIAGRLYCAGPGGIWVFDAEGIHLGTILTPETPSNCAWGGDDYRRLYITAQTSVYGIDVVSPGVPPWNPNDDDRERG